MSDADLSNKCCKHSAVTSWKPLLHIRYTISFYQKSFHTSTTVFTFCCCNLSEMLSNINSQPMINEVKFCRITHKFTVSGYFQNEDVTLLWEWVDVTPSRLYEITWMWNSTVQVTHFNGIFNKHKKWLHVDVYVFKWINLIVMCLLLYMFFNFNVSYYPRW